MQTASPPSLKSVLEALLFSAQKPLTPKELRDFLTQAAQDEDAPEAAAYRKTREDEIAAALDELEKDYASAGRSFRLVCVAGAWQFASQPEYAPWLRALLGRKTRPPRLSQPGLETLTIVAYRQPVTRAEIEQIRGVNVDGVMQTLLERGLIEAVGRAEVVGRPVTYGTTPLFLEYFGIRALEDLPAADELRRIPVQKPETLLTVDTGLATTPPEALSNQPDLPMTEPAAPPILPDSPELPSADTNQPPATPAPPNDNP
jgi:segregation and condensation protein B